MMMPLAGVAAAAAAAAVGRRQRAALRRESEGARAERAFLEQQVRQFGADWCPTRIKREVGVCLILIGLPSSMSMCRVL